MWHPDSVGKILVAAFATLDRLPTVRGPRGVGGHWPSTRAEWSDYVAQTWPEECHQGPENPFRPTAAEITSMETAFGWLNELRVEDPSMALVTTLWALRKARGKSIKNLCAEKRWAPHTFFRKRAKALAYLASILNARSFPPRVSNDHP